MTQNTIDVPSFLIDHTVLKAGLYLREHREDLNIKVWDLRFKAPSTHEYMSGKAMHAIEHIMALKLRELLGKDYVSFFIYGCTTGFGFISTSNVTYEILRGALIRVIDGMIPIFTKEEIPSLSEKECGRPHYFNLRETSTHLKYYLDTLLDEEYLKTLED